MEERRRVFVRSRSVAASYGSRARGEGTPTSDYDVMGVSDVGEMFRDARCWNGLYLDLFVYPEKKISALAAGYDDFLLKSAPELSIVAALVGARRIVALAVVPGSAAGRQRQNRPASWPPTDRRFHCALHQTDIHVTRDHLPYPHR